MLEQISNHQHAVKQQPMNTSVHFLSIRALMANNDGGQGWIVANIPYDLVSVIKHSTTQRTHTELYEPSVTAGRDGPKARVGVTVGCCESDGENKDSRDRTPFRTSTSPCLENRWVAISGSSVETIRFEGRDRSR